MCEHIECKNRTIKYEEQLEINNFMNKIFKYDNANEFLKSIQKVILIEKLIILYKENTINKDNNIKQVYNDLNKIISDENNHISIISNISNKPK